MLIGYLIYTTGLICLASLFVLKKVIADAPSDRERPGLNMKPLYVVIIVQVLSLVGLVVVLQLPAADDKAHPGLTLNRGEIAKASGIRTSVTADSNDARTEVPIIANLSERKGALREGTAAEETKTAPTQAMRQQDEQARLEMERAASAQSAVETKVEQARQEAEKAQRQLAKEREELIARHLVPSRLTNSLQTQDVAVLVVSEARQVDDAVGQALAAALHNHSANASASLFTPEFIADGLFERAFGGARNALNGLELSNAVDTLLFARESLEYSKAETVQGMVTASLKLELIALPTANHHPSYSHTTTATGVGFKETDARALAEERLLKQIGRKELDSFLSKIVNKPE